jgi:RND family efflux transporter MFP subunit
LLTRAGACLAAALALAACNGPSAPAEPAAIPVSVAKVLDREIEEWAEYSGRLEAVESVEVRPRVSGYIQKVNFVEGSEVKKGALLFVIDPRPLQAEYEQARAELDRAESQLELARTDLERSERLLASKAISQEEYDQRTAERRSSIAQVRAARAAVEAASLNLAYTRVLSPIDGRVGRAEVTEGNLVSGGQSGQATLLTTVVSLDPMYAYFDASEQDYLRYVELARRGERPSSRDAPNPVRMGLTSEQGYPHEGAMDFVDNRVDPDTGTIRARAVFRNTDRFLTPGLFVRIQLLGSGKYRAILINDRAVQTDQDRKFVLVVGGGNTLEYRNVTLGPIVGGLRVVRDGLEPGETIVVNGLQRVRAGATVAPSVVPMESPSAVTAG